MNPLSKFLKFSVVETTGPASYTTGGFSVTVGELEVVEHALVSVGGGYVGEIAGKSGNTVAIKVYSASGTEVTAGTDLSSVGVTVLAWGY